MITYKNNQYSPFSEVISLRLQTSLSEGDVVCEYLQMTEDSRTAGAIGFSTPITDELFVKLQGKGIKGGGRDVELKRLTGKFCFFVSHFVTWIESLTLFCFT